MITKYFKKLESCFEKYSHIIETYIVNKQIFTKEKGTIDGEVFFTDESKMSFLEAVNTNKKWKEKYSYHYMNSKNSLIFRYDNAKHHRQLKTFPHHKHTSKGVSESDEPKIEKILNEIETHITNKP